MKHNPYVVLSHESALWYHRLAAADLLSPAYSAGVPGLDGATIALPGGEHLPQQWGRISTVDLAQKSIYIKSEIENYLREHAPSDPMEALYYAMEHPHYVSYPPKLDLLSSKRAESRLRGTTQVHLSTRELPTDSILHAHKQICVASPELTVFQMARVLKEPHLVAALICELAGSYVLLPPGWIYVGRYLAEGRSPFKGRYLQGDGYVDCEPQTAVANLRSIVEAYPGLYGQGLVKLALGASGDGSVSPFETYVGVELQLSSKRGGRGLGPCERNKRIPLSELECKLSGGRQYVRADLLFTSKTGHRIDVEPDGVFGHTGRKRMNSDAQRRHALEHRKVEVIQVPWIQYENLDTWDALCKRIALHLGKYRKPPSQSVRDARWRVHKDFCSWNCLRVFPYTS
jgi:hypothetical protein